VIQRPYLTPKEGGRSAWGCALNRFFTRLQTLFIRMVPYAFVSFLVALSTLLFLEGMRPSPTLLGVLLGTQRLDHVLRPVQLLSPLIVLPLCYFGIAWSLGRGGHGMPTRVRLSVRGMMTWLAVVTAASYAGSRMWERRQERIFFATICGDASRGVRHTGATYRLNTNRVTLELIADEGTRARTPGQVEERRRRSVYWDALKEKYERAASYPWLSVEPDPPAP
jgi:hypothetical protein